MSRLTGFSPLVRHTINERAQTMCEVCGVFPVQQLHHRRARGMGSTRRPETNQAANGLACCLPCHRHIEENRKESLSAGWLVSQHRQPADVPVARRGVWVLLADNGDVQPIPEPATGSVA